MSARQRPNASKRPRRSADTYVPAHGDVPEHTLRLSDRARRVRLRITPREGLIVVVPRTMHGYDPSAALRERRLWIEEASARVAERRTALLAGADALLPDAIEFPATRERWHVEYRSSAAASVSARATGGVLVVQGAVDDGGACLAALQRWLQRAASERLLALLAEESARTGLAYRRASVRGQRSRWGSCTSAGTITLNRCLVFLPPELVRSIILHELAHLKHHDHSKRFWRFLEGLDPRAHEHRRATNHAWDAVPPWAEP